MNRFDHDDLATLERLLGPEILALLDDLESTTALADDDSMPDGDGPAAPNHRTSADGSGAGTSGRTGVKTSDRTGGGTGGGTGGRTGDRTAGRTGGESGADGGAGAGSGDDGPTAALCADLSLRLALVRRRLRRGEAPPPWPRDERTIPLPFVDLGTH